MTQPQFYVTVCNRWIAFACLHAGVSWFGRSQHRRG